jgi:hypothetical protein
MPCVLPPEVMRGPWPSTSIRPAGLEDEGMRKLILRLLEALVRLSQTLRGSAK